MFKAMLRPRIILVNLSILMHFLNKFIRFHASTEAFKIYKKSHRPIGFLGTLKWITSVIEEHIKS